jgi:hypothetical protein
MLCTLKYYDDEKRVFMPPDFESFSSSLAEMLEIDEQLLSSVIIFYLDKGKNQIMIQNEDDYGEILEQIQKKEVNTIYIELNPDKIMNDNKQIINENKNPNFNKLNNNNLNDNKNNNNRNINIEKNDVLKDLMGNKNNPNEIIFPIDCSKCHIYPVKNIIYKCSECILFFCDNCEKTEGIKHEHALYKIRNRDHFLKVNGVKEEKKEIKDNNNKEGTFGKWFGQIKNSFNNLINFNHDDEDKKMKQLVNILRNNYDLGNIPDEKIIEILNKTNGNMEEAINLLFQ